MLENVVKCSEFGYTREQCYTKVIYYYYYPTKLINHFNNNNNNILYSSQQEIKDVVRSHNEEHISIILSHETHAHTHS